MNLTFWSILRRLSYISISDTEDPISAGQMYLRSRQSLRAIGKMRPKLPGDVVGVVWSMMTEDCDLPNKLNKIISSHKRMAELSEEDRFQAVSEGSFVR